MGANIIPLLPPCFKGKDLVFIFMKNRSFVLAATFLVTISEHFQELSLLKNIEAEGPEWWHKR